MITWRTAGSAWLAIALGMIVIGCRATLSPAENLARYEFNEPQMGVPFRIVLYAVNGEEATNAATAAFARITELNDRLSDYDLASELSRLSRGSGQGHKVEVSADLWKILTHAQDLSHQTEGAFDITVGPAVNLWRKARRDQELPLPRRLESARRAIGYEKVRLDRRRRRVELLAPDMRLDLGGIAKGYAVDEALKVLRAHGISRALVAGAGDLAVLDPPPGNAGWRIEVAPLDLTNAPPSRFVSLQRMALATSGDIFQRLEVGGQRYSHIVDPRTGIGLTNTVLVTVIAQDCTTADSLATAVSVLGPEAGVELIEATKGAEALFVYPENGMVRSRQTSGFARFLQP